jgi:hypothetical protein
MVAVLVMLAVRGASDWSHSFEVVWYGSLIVADMLGVVGVVSSLLPGRPPERRGLALALSLPAFCTTAFILFVVVIVLGQLND